VNHRGHQQPGWLDGIDQRAQIRMPQHAVRVTQVPEDDADPVMAGQQVAGLLPDHGIIIHIDDPAARVHEMHHLVGVADGRQPGPDIDELADALLGYPQDDNSSA
jgi:hypothetical protein